MEKRIENKKLGISYLLKEHKSGLKIYLMKISF